MSSNQQRQSNQAHFEVRSLNAAQERGDSCVGHESSARQDKPQSWLLEPVAPLGQVDGVSQWCLRPRMNGAFLRRRAGAGERQSCSIRTTGASITRPRPNPSLERTSTGMAPRATPYYVASRGAMPVASAQLKR